MAVRAAATGCFGNQQRELLQQLVCACAAVVAGAAARAALSLGVESRDGSRYIHLRMRRAAGLHIYGLGPGGGERSAVHWVSVLISTCGEWMRLRIWPVRRLADPARFACRRGVQGQADD